MIGLNAILETTILENIFQVDLRGIVDTRGTSPKVDVSIRFKTGHRGPVFDSDRRVKAIREGAT
jgi:hypothetical protein